MQIKTVCHSNEDAFDAEVNSLISQGWKVDMSSYRVTPLVHTGTLLAVGRGGCYNSIILTKE